MSLSSYLFAMQLSSSIPSLWFMFCFNFVLLCVYTFILFLFALDAKSSVTFQEDTIGDLNVEEGPASRAIEIGDIVPLPWTVDVCFL